MVTRAGAVLLLILLCTRVVPVIDARGDLASLLDEARAKSARWRLLLDRFSKDNGRKYLFIPTFQAAFDDSRMDPPRGNPQMYPRTRADLMVHAAAIQSFMGTAYDRLGPFVVFSEF